MSYQDDVIAVSYERWCSQLLDMLLPHKRSSVAAFTGPSGGGCPRPRWQEPFTNGDVAVAVATDVKEWVTFPAWFTASWSWTHETFEERKFVDRKCYEIMDYFIVGQLSFFFDFSSLKKVIFAGSLKQRLKWDGDSQLCTFILKSTFEHFNE